MGLLIERVFCSGMRWGPRRPLIVNFSPFGVGLTVLKIYRGVRSTGPPLRIHRFAKKRANLCFQRRSGSRRPFIVKLSPGGSAFRPKALSKGLLYGPPLHIHRFAKKRANLCFQRRSGSRRPFIVKLSPGGSAFRPKALSKGLLDEPSLRLWRFTKEWVNRHIEWFNRS